MVQEVKRETVQVAGLRVSYTRAGEGPVLLILHGWGSSSARWEEAQKAVAQAGYQVVVPDMPGFGDTPPPPSVWGVEEYQAWLSGFAAALQLNAFSLMGHSFGGQVAIAFAADDPGALLKLILGAAAGVRREPALKDRALARLAHGFGTLLKVIPSESIRDIVVRGAYRVVGWRDYAHARGVMREVLQKVIRQDLAHIFPQVKVPTLILWGEKDNETPLQDARQMAELMPNATLKVLPGVGHRIRNEVPEALVEHVVTFLGS